MAQLYNNVLFRASVRISYGGRIASSIQRRCYSIDRRPAPDKPRRGFKLFESADEAIADVKDGDVILSAGFGLCGVAGTGDYLLILSC